MKLKETKVNTSSGRVSRRTLLAGATAAGATIKAAQMGAPLGERGK